MASGSAQGLFCEPRQAGNGATVANSSCVAVKSEAALGLKGVNRVQWTVNGVFTVRCLLKAQRSRFKVCLYY